MNEIISLTNDSDKEPWEQENVNSTSLSGLPH